MGLKPTTSTLRVRHATHCAITPLSNIRYAVNDVSKVTLCTPLYRPTILISVCTSIDLYSSDFVYWSCLLMQQNREIFIDLLKGICRTTSVKVYQWSEHFTVKSISTYSIFQFFKYRTESIAISWYVSFCFKTVSLHL